MRGPAVLQWNRSGWRCLWTGVLGLLGLLSAVVGVFILLAGGEWAGLPVVLVGLLLFGLSELWARRFRQVTTRGLRWQRSTTTDVFDWPAIGFSTTAVPDAPRDANDRILVHSAQGIVTWPKPEKHGDCVDMITWWQRAQREFPYGEFRAFAGLRPNLPAPPGPVRVLHNPGRRWWQAILALLTLVLGLFSLMVAIGDDGLPAKVGWVIVAAVALSAFGVSLRNATSSVRVLPDRIEQRRFLAWRAIPRDRIAGSYVVTRPKIVGLGGVTAVLLIFTLFDGHSGELEGPEQKQVPTLLLRDGTAVPLDALASRSTTRVHRFALGLVE